MEEVMPKDDEKDEDKVKVEDEEISTTMEIEEKARQEDVGEATQWMTSLKSSATIVKIWSLCFRM